MTDKVEPIRFREIKPGERFKLHKDEEGLKLGTLTKSGAQWFTAVRDECRVVRPSVNNLVEMRMVCDFEGQVEWVLGVRSPREFRVLELFDPARLAIDVEF